MTNTPDYSRNDELFADFYECQRELTRHFSSHPPLLRDWLKAVPSGGRPDSRSSRGARKWRTARLSGSRRRELAALLDRAETAEAGRDALAVWLLESLPVCTYCEIAAAARPSFSEIAPAGADCLQRLLSVRDLLFSANVGLAKAAARRRHGSEYAEMFSAASFGLLDAVDRYVPGDRSSRFAYFAGYWIRHHVERRSQKGSCVVSFPVNQHRIGRRIRGYLARRQAGKLPPPSEAELCAELRIKPEAFRRHQERPQVVSLDAPSDYAPDASPGDFGLCDPGPSPDLLVEEAEIAAGLQAILRSRTDPETRVILAYARSVGNLAEAVEEHLAALHSKIRTRLRAASRGSERADRFYLVGEKSSASSLPNGLQYE
jgi:DNA-directed RNA polymerase specialized sigma subunit